MSRPRITIARWMIVTAIIGANIAFVQSTLLLDRGIFDFGCLMVFALQLSAWRAVRSRGRRRRFWLGFGASGLASVLFSILTYPGLPLEGAFERYTNLANEQSYLHGNEHLKLTPWRAI